MEEQLFEMSQDDLRQLVIDSQSSLILGLISWIALGKKMGFDPFTAKTANNKGPEFFYALPTKNSKGESEKEVYE